MGGGIKPTLSRETHSRLNEVHDEMRASVNQILAAKGVDLQLHSLHLTSYEMNEVHEAARSSVNDILKRKGIPLQVHSLSLTSDDVASPGRCCTMNGEWVCGPPCP